MKKLLSVLGHLFQYVVLHKLNKVSYLRASGAKIGDNCDILTTIRNFGSEPWLIEIGNDVTLTAGVLLITHDGSSRLFRKKLDSGNKVYGNRFGKILIGNNCFIGVNAVILPGVTIGDNCIIGAGSIVNKDVSDGSVFAGNPARYICSLDDYIAKYKKQMVPCQSTDRDSLRQELTSYFWNEYR